MVMTCSAYGCQNSALMFGIHFFSFPKDPVLRKKWIIKTKRANFNPSSTAVLCSDHFNETDFELRTRPSFLRSILLPEEQIKRVKPCLIPGTIPSHFNFQHKDLCKGNKRKNIDLDFDETSNGPVGTQTKTAKIRGAFLKRERLRVLAEIDFGTTSSNSSQNIPSELSESSNDGSVSDRCSISQPSQIINESPGLVLQGNEISPSSKRNDVPVPTNSKGKVIPPRNKGNVIPPRSKRNVIPPRSRGNVIPPRSKGNVMLPSSSKGPKGILILETLKSQNNERQPSGRSILFLKRLEPQESHASQPSKPVITDSLLHRTDCFTLKSILKGNTTDQESHASQPSKPVITDTLLHRTDCYTQKSILKGNTTDQESHESQPNKPVITDTLLHRTDCFTLKSILKGNTTDLDHQKSSTPKQDIPLPCNAEEETVMTEDLRNEINNDSHNNTTVTLPQPAKESYTEEFCDIDVKEEVLEECLDIDVKEKVLEECLDIDVKEEVLEECLDASLTDTLTQSLIMTCETAEDESLRSEITDFVDVNRVSRFDCYDHFPAKAKRKAKRCQREGCRRKSFIYCRKCRVFLCISGRDTEEDCFYVYHHQ